MNLVDSCGWLEYFADGPNADFFAPALEDIEQLLVPSICLFEVFKRVLQHRSESDALRCVGLMRQGRCVELTDEIALGAARLSAGLKLAMADSVILYSARQCQATLWTQDAHFIGLPEVRYVSKAT
jgi:predicted nucleic acid-binding protein